MNDLSHFEMYTPSTKPNKVMAPATLLLAAATILHLSNLCASASDEKRSTPVKMGLTYLESIKDPVIRRAIKFQVDYCPHTDICNASFGFDESENMVPFCGKCSCDVDCRRECCPNIVADLDQLAVAEGNELECQYPVLQLSQQNRHSLFFPPQLSGYYFITDCPPGYNMEEREKCRTLRNNCVMSEGFDCFNVTPVTDIRSQLNYWNAFCASCHGIVNENLLAWVSSLNCINSLISDVSLIENNIYTINTNECNITFQPPKLYTPEKCTPRISSCNQTGFWAKYDEEIERLCHSPLGSSFNSTYKNVFCMICNTINPVFTTVCPTPFSFPILLELQHQNQVHQVSTESATDEVFAPYLMKFQQLYCSRTKTLNNYECVNNKSFDEIDGVIFDIEITFFPLEKCPVKQSSDVATKIGTWFKNMLPNDEESKYFICNRDTVFKLNNCYTLVKEDYIEWYSQAFDSIITFISSKWKIRPTRFLRFDLIYEKILNIAEATVRLQLDSKINITLAPRLTRIYDIAHLSECTSYIPFPTDLSVLPLTNTSDFDTDYLDEGSAGDILPHNGPGLSTNIMDEEDFSDYLSDSNAFESRCDTCSISNAYITLFLSDLIPCAMVELDEQLFNWSYTLYGIYVPKLNLSLNMTDFNVVNIFSETRLRICKHLYLPHPVAAVDKFQRVVSFEANTILSIICTFMSLICILMTLIVYIVFPELRTVPGQINMLLVISLIMAQVMYLVYEFTPTSTDPLCKGVGVLLHFFWLSAIFWMHMSTFHMFKKFVRLSKPQPKTSSTKTVIIYTVIAIVSSLIFVLTNIITALVETDMVEMGYGSQICYISSGKMVGFTFALPVGFVVLSNLVMFCVIICKLRSLPHVEMNVKHRRNNVLIIAKLSSLTGVTWIFGFLYIWTEEYILSYFFIVLNASIGIFIMASFILNKRVMNLIRSKFLN
ncbi:hypothetical protein CHS0354_000901 [Potamilus streckersoni]|uniref:G-protein coupled receptors family 2 profile 2 domain-containing protein n=1 Tax=Potamilus streckersoni TaxID=2493646 RepID=A0AAE0S702_9BIVA|nr:hypothetical protein CHS0354_000901 [Potamilus streckersoni]